MSVKEDDVVFCKVTKIDGTSVFLEIDGESKQGSMTLSEVAAGRIRNLKKFVSPGRMVVCKVLRVLPDYVELSLRRVTTKEREELLESHKRERAFWNMLEVVGEEPQKIISEIKKEYNFIDFFDEAREDKKVLETFLSKEKAQKVFEILAEKSEREKIVNKKIVVKSFSENGINDLREILKVEAEVHYLGNSTFSISISGKDFKEANLKLDEILKDIEKRVKDRKAVLEIKKEK